MLSRIDSLARFRRHVVFVVLREHLVGVKDSVGANMSLRDAAFAFLKQVGKNSFVDNRNALGCVSNREADGQTVAVALQRSVLHQPTNAKSFVNLRLPGCDLRRTEEEHQIVLKAADDDWRSNRQACNSDNN